MTEPRIGDRDLFNEIPAGQIYPANEKWTAHLLDQYKLYVEMADRISNRRATANSYFLSLNSAIIAFVGYVSSKESGGLLWLLALAGMALSVLWRALIISYRNLNAAKFLVIHRLEKHLPASIYDAEWDAMGRGLNPKRYRPFGHIELGVPFVFLALHAVVFLRTAPWRSINDFTIPAWPGC